MLGAMRILRLLAPSALVAPMLVAPGRARADLTDDVERLTARWLAKEGTTVDRRPPLFVEHARLTVARLQDPPKAAPAASSAPVTSTSAQPAPAAGCTTVVLVAPRTSEIAALTDGAGPATPAIPPSSLPLGHPVIAGAENGPIRSKAGVAVIERCGKDQAAEPLEGERLLVQSISPRTAVEVLVVRSRAPIERVESILPARAEGPVAPRGDAGRPPDPGPLADRLARVERRGKEAGAERILKVTMRASSAGTGAFVVKLGEGCHGIDVLADAPPTARRGTDVDAHAHVSEGGRPLARDRGESPDAHLDFCLGEAAEVEIGFTGASGEVDVTLVDALWSLPAGIPSEWGPQVRGDVALALRRRHAPPLPAEPIATFLGVQGETMVPFVVEPGQCYLAAAALVRGDARALRLAVEIGDRAPHDEIADRPEAAQVAFCAAVEDRAALRVDARGSQPWWVGLVWRVTP